MRASSWWASSPATTRTSPVTPSWGLRGACWIARWPRWGSRAPRPTSATRSSTSSGPPRASDACTSGRAAASIERCKPWLEAELALIRPEVLVALGAVAAQALFGPSFRVTAQRGQLVKAAAVPYALATVHPSSILRSRSSEEREQAFEQFCADLRVAKRLLERAHVPASGAARRAR